LKRFLKITLALVVSALVLVYACDYAFFRYRSASKRNPYGSVTVRHYYAVQHKNGKTEFLFGLLLHRFVCTPFSRMAATHPAGISSAIQNRGPISDPASREIGNQWRKRGLKRTPPAVLTLLAVRLCQGKTRGYQRTVATRVDGEAAPEFRGPFPHPDDTQPGGVSLGRHSDSLVLDFKQQLASRSSHANRDA
jgi:hypothetical protein